MESTIFAEGVDKGSTPCRHLTPVNPIFKSAGFTLVELLVVIGIIALLISILLPALAKARISAESAKCKSNLAQICLAFNEYIADHKGAGWINQVLPAGQIAVNGTLCRVNQSWGYSSTVPVGGGTYTYDVSGGWMSQYVKNLNVFVCPTFPVESVTMQTTQSSTSYAVTGYPGTRITSVRDPASTFFAADGASLTSTYSTSTSATLLKFPSATLQEPTVCPPQVYFHARHGGKANVAWFDGHVSVESLYYYRAQDVNAQGFGAAAQQIAYVQHLGTLSRANQSENIFTINDKEANYYYYIDKYNGIPASSGD